MERKEKRESEDLVRTLRKVVKKWERTRPTQARRAAAKKVRWVLSKRDPLMLLVNTIRGMRSQK